MQPLQNVETGDNFSTDYIECLKLDDPQFEKNREIYGAKFIAKYYELPEEYSEGGSARDKDCQVTVETGIYKTVNFWYSVLKKYGYGVFEIVYTGKVGKYGKYLDFVANISEISTPIYVDIAGRNFIMSNISVSSEKEEGLRDISFLMYNSKQSSKSGNDLFRLMHILSCIQFNLYCKFAPHSMNQLVFSYSPYSTKETNISIKPRVEPFIKFSMTIDKPIFEGRNGKYDMNTIFVAYEERTKTKKSGLVPCGTEFVPITKKMTIDTLQKEITEGSIAMNASIDMSNMYFAYSCLGYLSFKAQVRNLVYFRNPRPPKVNVTIDSKSEMYNDLVNMAHGNSDEETDEDATSSIDMTTDNGLSKRVRAQPSEYEMMQSISPSKK